MTFDPAALPILSLILRRLFGWPPPFVRIALTCRGVTIQHDFHTRMADPPGVGKSGQLQKPGWSDYT